MTVARVCIFLLVAAALWLPSLHWFHGVNAAERDAIGRALVARQRAAAVAGDVAAARMRAVNPEWDFMQRTFLVLALANRAVAAPAGSDERTGDLHAIDAIVDATVATADHAASDHFLLPYAKRGPFVDRSARSLFIDGEIVAMIAARDLVEPRAATRAGVFERAARIERTMRRSPTLSGESYPDECWTFCNTTALAGLRMLDRTTAPGEGPPDHAALARDWVAYARAHLVDPKTGLLVSSYTYAGDVLDGPEGSSIWMSAHNLLVVDEAFARDQYARARAELGVSFLGFGWAREWPKSVPARPDVDSGPIIPLLDASAGSSGFALLGATAFGDQAWLGELFSSVELAGFRDAKSGRYRASNDVGDAVLAYALSFGPLWRRVGERSEVAAR